ncbi:CRISPR-associated helicase Cas3' [Candidatus Micrarchaeota archaeon]|nr:CRISPR-associated helicase Cas3' [Candidatus Micrarchaeota archaeon]
MSSIDDVFQEPDYSKLFRKEYLDGLYARPISEDGRVAESLTNHSQITLEIFDKLVGELSLKPTFQKLIEKAFGKSETKLWSVLRAIIYFHDFGKMNDSFQDRIKEQSKKNLEQSYNKEKLKKTSESDHSLPGLFIFGLLLETYLKNEDEKTKATFFYLASVIARHHTNLQSPIDIGDKLDGLWEKSSESEFKRLVGSIQDETRKTDQIINLSLWFDPKINSPSNRPGAIFRYMQENLPENIEQRESIFYLHKLLYSCLVSADYYAAYHRETPETISNTLPDIDQLKENLTKFLNLKKSDDDVSKAREKFRLFSSKRLLESSGKNVFYLYLPTGGGKTLTSLSLALELAEKSNAKRLFYVFPFVNIIEQNQDVLKKALGNELISPIYSYSEWDLKENEDDKTHFVNQEFTNYPVVVLSNVNFFNALIKNGKNSNYKLHNFANSVIIIDEIQSLNSKEWTLYNDLITNTAKMLNSKIIVMSASIPPIHKLSEEEIENEVKLLIEPDQKELREEFAKFWQRVDLRLEDDEKELSNLAEEKIKEYNYPDKVLVVANTIKKSIITFKKLQKSKHLKEKYEDKILLLNSTMLPSRRKELVKQIGKENERLILVSTQSVEAGLDVDFDLGIRELAPLDNLLQVCGRVNRNMKKDNVCSVYVATKNTEKDSIVYGELRFRGESKKGSGNDNMQEKIKDLLKNKEKHMDEKYVDYSNDLVRQIQKQNKDIYRETQRHSVESLRDLDFESLDEHKVIEQSSISIFAPIDIDLQDIVQDEISQKSRLLELAQALDKNLANGSKILDGTKLISKNVLGLYLSVCKSKNKDKKVELKKLAPLFNQFMFSVSHNRAHRLSLYTEDVFSNEKKRYPSTFLKLKDSAIETDENPKGIYSLKNGLKIDELRGDNQEAIIF